MTKQKEQIVLQTDERKIEGYEVSGTLEGWREQVGKMCIGNSRLLTAVSASFGAPLLHPLGQQGFGLNLYGDSSTGKSTLLRAAKSVKGDHNRMPTWRATSNALESVAALHNDAALMLDEMGEADPKTIGPTAYMLANGEGKKRQNRNMTAKETLRWRLIILSSGEIRLADAVAQGGQRIKAGQEVRLIDTPADAGAGLGIFDHLPPQFAGGAQFADHLRDAATEHHGHAFIAFLTQLTDDMQTHMQTVRDFRATWLDKYLPKEADSQVGRVAESFATIAAGGELATDFGITGWPDDAASEGVAACFNAWIKQRGGVGNQEPAEILRFVRNHFQEHGAAKYAKAGIRLEDDKTMYRMGYYNSDGDFFVLAERFNDEFCIKAGFDKAKVVQVLDDNGYLVYSDPKRKTVLRRFYAPETDGGIEPKKPMRVYHIDGSIMDKKD